MHESHLLVAAYELSEWKTKKQTCVLRIRRSADDLFVSSSCSIFCSKTKTTASYD